MCIVNILNSVNATPTVRIVLNKEKQIWKPKGKLSDISIEQEPSRSSFGKISGPQLFKTYDGEIVQSSRTLMGKVHRSILLEGLGHNLISEGNLVILILEVAFRKHSCFDRDINYSEPVPTATVVNASIVSTNTSVSTMIAQDAPSTSHSLSSSQVHPPVFPQGVAAGTNIEGRPQLLKQTSSLVKPCCLRT
ncbi:hypothetical protein Tco_0064467 [Tanacetum coccineum]